MKNCLNLVNILISEYTKCMIRLMLQKMDYIKHLEKVEVDSGKIILDEFVLIAMCNKFHL